jgi:hypothetical protein
VRILLKDCICEEQRAWNCQVYVDVRSDCKWIGRNIYFRVTVRRITASRSASCCCLFYFVVGRTCNQTSCLVFQQFGVQSISGTTAGISGKRLARSLFVCLFVCLFAWSFYVAIFYQYRRKRR